MLAALTDPARQAFTRLRLATMEAHRRGEGMPGKYVFDVRTADVELLLAETTVSVGMEVDLLDAQQALVEIDKLVCSFRGDNLDKLVGDIASLVDVYFDGRSSS